MSVIIAGTDHGVVVATDSGAGYRPAFSALAGHHVTSVIAREGVILAGTREGVHQSDDGGQTWWTAAGGMRIRYVRWLAYHPDISDREFAGTEPAGIFVSHDGAATWRGCPEVEALRDEGRWFLPYSPEAGCVRGFAFHGSRAYAAVEVGGVLRSDDSGETWRLAAGSTGKGQLDIPPSPLVQSDVHSLVGHPGSPDLVYAATGEGFYISDDGGDTWAAMMPNVYCRAVWVDPNDADHIIVGPADSVRQKNGRIEESRDRGRSWHDASSGLDLPWPDGMVERFHAIDANLFAVTSDGRLYASGLDAFSWRRMLEEVEGITSIWQVE